MSHVSLVPLALAGLVLGVASSVAAQGVEVTAEEFSLQVAGGPLEAGSEVRVTYANDGTVGHSLFLARAGDEDEAGATPASAAFAHTAVVAAGNERSLLIEVPTDVSSLYLWCDVGDHEGRGMKAMLDVSGASEGGDGGDNTSSSAGDQTSGSAPLGGVLPLVVVLVAAALAGGRRPTNRSAAASCQGGISR